MSAFFVATSRIKDSQKYAEYGANAVVRFPDTAALKTWYQSPAYQALIPLRDEAVDMTLVAYEEPS